MWAAGASLVVQYLRFHALNAGVSVSVRVRVQSLARELDPMCHK